ncbi:hypothetical protein T265_06476 [Opisthorchis viverrini]|uniref:Uncharacterized protein n=1 Tax=Opisthorchis viverrini TaxID=6198 RepID=A0A074ZG02_OPIVI|nr:hypothetical protein T265_06476 [Opisthorchis viverrini]KER26191.1 hypothetical protein T265_06476 [Opisthorchis viverrini]
MNGSLRCAIRHTTVNSSLSTRWIVIKSNFLPNCAAHRPTHDSVGTVLEISQYIFIKELTHKVADRLLFDSPRPVSPFLGLPLRFLDDSALYKFRATISHTSHIIPRLTYSLVLGQVHRNTLKRLDNHIRQYIRGWLRLPKDTPNGYIHAGEQHGGLGIPSLSATIPMQRKTRMEKLLSTQCRVLRNVVNDSAFGKIVRDLSLPIRVHGACVNTKEELVAAWGESLHNSADGRALHAIGCDIDFLVHQPMIISYRGICFPQSAKAVIGLGLPKVAVSDLCLLAIVGSLRTYDTFMRGTWR